MIKITPTPADNPHRKQFRTLLIYTVVVFAAGAAFSYYLHPPSPEKATDSVLVTERTNEIIIKVKK